MTPLRRLPHVGRLVARQWNDLLAATNATNRALMLPGGVGVSGAGCQWYMSLSHDVRWQAAEYVPVQSVGFRPPRKAPDILTLAGASAIQAYSRAAHIRHVCRQQPGGAAVFDYQDLSALPPAALLVSPAGGGVSMGPLTSGDPSFLSGSTTRQDYPTTGTDSFQGWYAVADACAAGQPNHLFGDPLAVPPAENPGNEITSETHWRARSYDAPYCRDVLGNIVDRFWGWPENPSGPGWEAGVGTGTGLLQNYPVTLGQEMTFPNYCGAAMILVGGFPLWQPSSMFSGSVGMIGRPWPIRAFPDGTQIVDAKIEVSVASFLRHSHKWTQSSFASFPVISDVVNETTADAGFVLLGRYVPSYRRTVWEPVAHASGGTVVAGKTCVVDAQAIFQAMIDPANRKYTAFAVLPAKVPLAPGGRDAAGFLAGLLPDITLGVELDPGHTGDYWGGSDHWFYASGQGEYVTWGDVGLGKAWVKWKYPNGVLDEARFEWNMPPTD